MPLVVWSPPRWSIMSLVKPVTRTSDLLGHALAAVVVDAEEGRVQDPERAVLVDQAARMVHLGEDGDLIDLAVAVLIDAAQHLAAAGRSADRPLLIDGHEHFARGAAASATG